MSISAAIKCRLKAVFKNKSLTCKNLEKDHRTYPGDETQSCSNPAALSGHQSATFAIHEDATHTLGNVLSDAAAAQSLCIPV